MSESTKLEDIRAMSVDSLRLGPKNSQFTTLTDLVTHAYRRKCITYRRHGQNGELLKPMHHRFEVKGGHSHREALVANVTANNAFFKRLCQS